MKSALLRAMRAEDVAEVAALARASLREGWDEQGFAAELAKSTARALVVVDGVRIVAFGIGSLVLDELEVLTIAVAPESRRAGLGRAVLRALVKDTRTAHLEVRAGNSAAIALYTTAGFHEVGRRRRYYADGEDAVLMASEPAT